MDDEKKTGPEASPPAGDISGEDRQRAHFAHARIVEDAAKAHAPGQSDADLIAQATDRHHEEVVKPSLLPTPNSVDASAPAAVPDDEDET